MVVASVIKLSKLQGARRFDADRYNPKYLQLEDRLRSLPNIRKLRTLIAEPVKTGHTPRNRDIHDDDEKIRFIKTDTLRKGSIDFENADFLPARSLAARDYLRPKNVIVTIIGAHFDIIGRAAIVLANNPKSAVNQNIAVMTTNGKLLNPFYLMVFLNCRYGREQLWMLSRQTEQVNLNCREVEEVLVPLFSSRFQQEIERTVKNSSELMEKSKSLYIEAEKHLLEQLGLRDFKAKYKLIYTDNLSNVFRVHRVDAEYFQPTYDHIEKYLIRKQAAMPIRKINFISVTTGQYAERYVDKEEGRPYIRGTDIKNGTITTEGLVHISSEDQIENKKAKEGDVVVTRVGTIGSSARIPKECEGGTISDNLIRLRFEQNKLNSYYLSVFLGSPIGISLMIRNGRGSVQQRLNQETLKEVVIPLLSNKTQEKIALIVQKSHSARNKAKELLEEAKRKVEQKIESEGR